MEADNPNTLYYSKEELQEYSTCPEVIFTGSHLAGLRSCVYCAEVYRRYHNITNADYVPENPKEEDVAEEEEKEEATKGIKKISLDDENDIGCDKLVCARAGWCMCD